MEPAPMMRFPASRFLAWVSEAAAACGSGGLPGLGVMVEESP